MKKLAKYFRGYRAYVALAPTFKTIEAIFELITPMLVAVIIDTALPAHDAAAVWTQGGFMVLLGVLGLGFSLACQYLASRSSYAFATALRADMLHHVNTLSYRDLDRIGAASLATRITNDVNALQNGTSQAMRLLTRLPCLIIGATIGAILISPEISLVFLAVSVLISLALWFIMSRSAPYYRRAAKELDRVAGLAKENMTGARVIRAYGKEAAENARSREAVDTLTRTNLRVNFIAALLNPVTLLIVNIGIIAVIAWGGDLAIKTGDLTAGKIIALVNYLMQIQLALVVLANLIVVFTRTSAAAARVLEVLDIENTLPEKATEPARPIAGAPLLELDNIAFRYNDTADLCIDGVSWTIPEGAHVGIIGGTGSGKTTLVNLLTYRYEPTHGTIRLDGVPIADYPSEQLLSNFGIVPQTAALFSGTIRSNLTWRKADATDDELWHALELAQAADFVRAYPDGLNHPVTQNGHNFSGGQRQRLTIARALVGAPRILIFDDSSSALDAGTDYRLRQAIATLGVTVITVSQRTGSLRDADAILVLDGGEVAGLGTHEELLASSPVYREIHNSQTAKETNNG